jgi:glycosyltransferase involved in cell wall biosynthesis
MGRLKVSIVTTSYNQAHFIDKTIQNVMEQNYPDIEHIIIDGVSTDGTIDVLRKYNHLTWVSEPDEGQSDALNKGLKMVSGDIVGILNSDDLYKQGIIPLVLEEFKNNPDLDLIYGDCDYIDENGEVLFTYKAPAFNFKKLITCCYNYIPPMSSFFRKRVLDTVGLFDTNLNYTMDHDFFIRAGLKCNIKKLDYILSGFRIHDTSKTVTNILKMRRESYEISKKYGGGKYPSLYFNWMRSLILLSNPKVVTMLRKIKYKYYSTKQKR